MIKTPVYFSIFFENLLAYFPKLMINCMGHTVCRAIYSQPHCALPNKLLLLNSLLPKFASIASSRQGSFAIICIMSLMTTSEEIGVLIKAFVSTQQDKKSNVKNNDEKNETDIQQQHQTLFDDIILSQSGYHVVKKFIGFGYPHFNCILTGISKDFTKYATHHYGVPIIRSIFDMISANDKLITEYTPFLQLFAQHTRCLICNQYGNYVIQQLLEISPKCVTDTIKEFMLTKYSDYSKHKFASNVVEKCLEHTLYDFKKEKEKADDNENKNENENEKENEHKNEKKTKKALSKNKNKNKNKNKSESDRNWICLIVRELLFDASELINHKFGNYCLQTALSVVINVCEEEQELEMKIMIMPLLKEFICTLYPLLHVLRLSVKKKWQQLLQSATRHYDENEQNDINNSNIIKYEEKHNENNDCNDFNFYSNDGDDNNYFNQYEDDNCYYSHHYHNDYDNADNYYY